MQFLIVYFIFLILQYSVSSEISRLKHVHIIFRHGDRAPINIFPTDINRENIWVNGLGQLTDKGIIEHFQLGQWLRKRYFDFLGSHLNYSLIHVRSTNVDRTLMSAESNLAGLFFNSSKDIIKGLKWRPFPVHTVSMKSDVLLNGIQCPAYDKMRKELYESEYFRKKLEPYQSTLEMIRTETGYTNLTFPDVWKVYDTLYCEKEHNLTWNSWVTNEVWNKLAAIDSIDWQVMNYEKLPKLIAGFLLNQICKNIMSLVNSPTSNSTKMIIYSGHDTDVAPLAALLEFFNNIQPAYTSTILIELHYVPSKAEKWAVKVFYKNYTDSSGSTDISPEIIPGCGSPLCPLTKFMEIIKSKILSKKEHNEICYSKNNILSIVHITFFIVALCIILFIMVMFIIQQYCKAVPHRYSRIETEPSIN